MSGLVFDNFTLTQNSDPFNPTLSNNGSWGPFNPRNERSLFGSNINSVQIGNNQLKINDNGDISYSYVNSENFNGLIIKLPIIGSFNSNATMTLKEPTKPPKTIPGHIMENNITWDTTLFDRDIDLRLIIRMTISFGGIGIFGPLNSENIPSGGSGTGIINKQNTCGY